MLRLAPFATAVYMRVRPAEVGTSGLDVVWSNAGHPAPVLVSADGVATALDQGRHPVLGAVPDVTRSSSRVTLPVGSTLLLFSDGLFERRHRDLDDCFDDVLRHASRIAGLPSSELSDALMRAAPHDDDVVLVAVRNDSAER